VQDIDYQTRLRRDFARRRLHPSIESMVWAYHLGKPKEQVEMTGKFTMNQRLEAERQLIRSMLDPSELELLAAQSQKLLDDALAWARAKLGIGAVVDVVASASGTAVGVEVGETSADSGEGASNRNSE
jgi:hypothetical protein